MVGTGAIPIKFFASSQISPLKEGASNEGKAPRRRRPGAWRGLSRGLTSRTSRSLLGSSHPRRSHPVRRVGHPPGGGIEEPLLAEHRHRADLSDGPLRRDRLRERQLGKGRPEGDAHLLAVCPSVKLQPHRLDLGEPSRRDRVLQVLDQLRRGGPLKPQLGRQHEARMEQK